jgi:hypothetical protein
MPRTVTTDLDDTILKDGQAVQPVVDYIAGFKADVVIITARDESRREATVKDLESIGFAYSQLIMKSGEVETPAFKRDAVAVLIEDGADVLVFIDNDESNREAVETLGVEVVDPADIVSGDDEEEDSEDSLNQDAKNMTIEEVAKEASAALLAVTAERDDLRATIEAATIDVASKVDALTADVSAKDARIAELTSALEAATAKVAALEASAESAVKVAAKIVASTGTNPIADAGPKVAASGSVVEQWKAMPVGPERTDFFTKNQAAILRAHSK